MYAKAMTMPPCDLVPACLGNGSRSRPSVDEARTYFGILEESIYVRTHRDLLDWLQGRVQAFLPHSILLAAWGDFAHGSITYDVVSMLPDIRTDRLEERQSKLLLRGLFCQWQSCDRAPIAVPTSDQLRYLIGADSSLKTHEVPCNAETVLVHGIRDQRSRHDCLYALIGDIALGARQSKYALTLLLPYLDTALRRITHLSAQHPPESAPTDAIDVNAVRTPSFDLSQRELEILRWVGMGKTNHEIGIILDVSGFTVKNHLQRTFRKLNVINRAQAVARLQSCALPAGAARRQQLHAQCHDGIGDAQLAARQALIFPTARQ
jgi:transcriptional regulator EpsA